MSHSKVHSQGKVPFSWENKPGVTKVTTVHQEYVPTIKLQPPPCPPDQATKGRVLVHDQLQVHLPPCAFQPPEVSKVMTTVHKEYHPTTTIKKLPPPPCPPDHTKARILVHDLQVPLPPCAFQPPTRSLSKRGLWKHDDDPFLNAYKECTKNTKKKSQLFGDGRTKKSMSFFSFSCKNSCSVRDDNLVKISHLPYSLSGRERA